MYDQQADPGARAGGGPADAGHGVEVLAVVGGEDDEAVLGLNALEAVGHGKTVRSEFTLMVDRRLSEPCQRSAPRGSWV